MSRSGPRGPKLPKGLLDHIDAGNQKRRQSQSNHYRRQDPRKPHGARDQEDGGRRTAQSNLVNGPGRKQSQSVETSRINDGASSKHSTKVGSEQREKLTDKRRSNESSRENGSRVVTHSVKESSPAPLISRAVKDKLAGDDAEIAALEKRLGIKSGKNTSKGLEEDGLDFLLDGLGESAANSKRKRDDYDEYLQNKRRAAIGLESSDDDIGLEDDAEVEEDDGGVLGSDDDLAEGMVDEDDEDATSDDDADPETHNAEDDREIITSHERKRENPYVAPVTDSGKYVPPSLRRVTQSDADDLARVKRQVQGLLNRLSEANSVTIVRDIERLYQEHPRQYVTTSIIDLLLASLADNTRLNDTFIVLHAGFVAGLYKVIGIEFGAQFVERLVSRFDDAYEAEQRSQESKVAANLVSLMATLYIFQVITATLVFDYVRIFLQSVSETNTELLLLVVRSCGVQLRQDDPSSLKDIITMLHAAVADTGEANLSVRTKFMMETVNNLKNNRAKAGATASAMVGEHITRMKKAVGTLSSRKASESLRLSLADVRNADKKGKWWLVGASWKGEGSRDESAEKNVQWTGGAIAVPEDDIGDQDGEADLLALAKTMGMNTEIRRAVFISIMSATDIKDAEFRLSKLRLKKAQEMEIPRVLIKCAGAEQSYNPYYALVAQRLCTRDHKLQKAFRFSLWDLFKRMGEKSSEGDETDEDDDNEEEEKSISIREIVNLGKMFGTLIRKLALPITSLKILRFAMLQPQTASFLEVLFVTVFEGVVVQSREDKQQETITRIFEDTRLAPEMLVGQKEFLEDLLRGDALREGKHAKAVRQSCRHAVREMRRLTQDSQSGGY